MSNNNIMSDQNYNITRLAYIDAAAQTVELPEKILNEKEEIIKKLEEVKMLVVQDGKFTFVDQGSESLYKESFQDF